MDKINIGVVGGGTMGQGIAQVAATAGHRVILYDAFSEALDSARSKLTRILNRLVEKERITEKKSQEIMGNILFSNDLDDCSNCEFII
ncbi:MAG: 3-hydroxyacyl-CoA dehydrogenase NAD-binding domain-containing protein, partial [Saprospiraceae bacterium]|nr:3-hydroxyacyl-CoA dehydrogenase NAD-binding domain-containing protein [Saprospiraceae bacterium]